ncbi:hypothetical protein RI367_006812 [Sorochytrium milnesiophthora]
MDQIRQRLGFDQQRQGERQPLLTSSDRDVTSGLPHMGPTAANASATSLENGRHRHSSSIATVPEPPSTAASRKLGTFSGVFLPVFLSIWSLLFYLRFGFLIGQGGMLGVCAMLLIGYFITTMTALSVSAISTNGRIKSGGPYYLISRCLGAEFGGSIGLVFYLGSVFGCAMSCVGFVEPLMDNFGQGKGDGAVAVLPTGKWYEIGYASALLIICGLLCIVGKKLYAKLNGLVFIVLNVATITSVGSLLLSPDSALSWTTFQQNLLPEFTAAFTAKDLFAILFPSCCGILAGASMSGELKSPSRSIPSGTLYGMGSTLAIYLVSIVLIGASVPREVLLNNYGFMQSYNLLPITYILGVFASCVFGVFGGLIGTANILQAVFRDRILPMSYGKSARGVAWRDAIGSELGCLFLTYALTQLVVLLVSDLNTIAPFFTQTSLLCYATLNLACLLLRVAGAPNFRPGFSYFKTWTAASGLIMCVAGMFVVDLTYAGMSLLVEVLLFCAIYFYGEPKKWGDVSQSLMYHQVRKYLLKMDRRIENVKFWRPQALLFVNNPNHHQNLIQFCNHLKKGSLYVLAHVIEAPFETNVRRYKFTLNSWLEAVERLAVKAFVHVVMSSSFREGAQGVMMGAGLGSMRPNFVIVSFPESRQQDTIPFGQRLPPLPPLTNVPFVFNQTTSPKLSSANFIHLLRDALSLDHAIAVARHFDLVATPSARNPIYIDLWPICFNFENSQRVLADLARMMQGSPTASEEPLAGVPVPTSPLSPSSPSHSSGSPAKDRAATALRRRNTLTIGDEDDVASFTLILQLGYILRSVDEWRDRYKLRLWIVVEHRRDIGTERAKVEQLLQDLRMREEIRVVCLEDEDDLLSRVTADISAPVATTNSIGSGGSSSSFDATSSPLSQSAPQLTSDPEDLIAGYQAAAASPPPMRVTSALDRFKSATLLVARRLADPTGSERNRPAPLTLATINDIPLSVRAKLLNRLYHKYSPPSVAAILFTTLPSLSHVDHLPHSKKSQSAGQADAMQRYVDNLDALTANLGPTMLVQARKVTITNNL